MASSFLGAPTPCWRPFFLPGLEAAGASLPVAASSSSSCSHGQNHDSLGGLKMAGVGRCLKGH